MEASPRALDLHEYTWDQIVHRMENAVEMHDAVEEQLLDTVPATVEAGALNAEKDWALAEYYHHQRIAERIFDSALDHELATVVVDVGSMTMAGDDGTNVVFEDLTSDNPF